MRERPQQVNDADVLAVVRQEWDPRAEHVEHLPVGFGAHHWAASRAGVRTLFVTLDKLAPRRSAAELEGAYAAAACLAADGLHFVLPCERAASGSFTVPLTEAALSVTAWREGISGDGDFRDRTEVSDCARMLARLHAATPPAATPLWRPVVDESFADDLAEALARPWHTGPYGVPARQALRDHLGQIAAWTARYHVLADEALAARESWVPTHGEPHTANHLVTPAVRLFVDWESLRLAPRERDLRPLVDSGRPWAAWYLSAKADLRMLEMFDLEWRLDEVNEYSAWFAAAHAGSAGDAVAFDGLLEELRRPGRVGT